MTNDSEEPRLTEAEWLRKQAQAECARWGHYWQIVSTGNEPVAVYCDRDCGAPEFAVTRREPSK